VNCPACGAAFPARDRSSETPQSSRDRADESANQERQRRVERGESESPTTTNRGVGVVLVVAALLFFGCCSGVGYMLYTAFEKPARSGSEPSAADLRPKNDRVSRGTYVKIDEGMTPTEVEALLGRGRPVGPAELAALLGRWPSGGDRIAEWQPKAQRGRVMAWQSADDFILIAYYPNPGINGRVQLRAFIPATGAGEAAGIADDEDFTRKLPPQAPR